tara:strand:+ start:225 stop:617 length:393 start_codon:yes stop_codon:yes gene_type:complete
MANNSELVNNIKNYLELDKEIEQLNSRTTELRKKRGIYEERLVTDICKKKLDNKMLTVSKDLGLVCQQNKVLPNLTLDIVKMALNEKISNRETVNTLIKHISTYREKNRKTDYVIKKRKPGRRSFRKKKL